MSGQIYRSKFDPENNKPKGGTGEVTPKGTTPRSTESVSISNIEQLLRQILNTLEQIRNKL